MLGTQQPQVLAAFYEKIIGRPAEMVDGSWSGWQVGSSFFAVGEHSEMRGAAKEPGRVLFNFETKEVKAEFERMKAAGAGVIKAPYEMQGMWIATLADPDGNYFQLMSPWEGD